MPDLDNLINALECPEWREKVCKNCPYGYVFLDDAGDFSFWRCDEEQLKEDALVYLKIYRKTINDETRSN